MTVTAIGPLLDLYGMAHQRSPALNWRTGAWETRHACSATPAANVRRRQASFIGVDVNHDRRWVGRVEYLELDKGERLWCVATLDRFDPDSYQGPLYFSPSLVFDEGTGADIEVTSVGIVQATAENGSLPRAVPPRQHRLPRLHATVDNGTEHGKAGAARACRRAARLQGSPPPHPRRRAQQKRADPPPRLAARRCRTRDRTYDLRSTFASNALAASVSIFELARIMGTSVAMIERHYGALLDGAGAGIAERLDAFEAELEGGAGAEAQR